jgi:hypothetical protein
MIALTRGLVSHPPVRVLRTSAVTPLAVTAALEFAHLLELPRKLTYDANLYVRVSHSLYLWFAYVGAPAEILGILLPAALTIAMRGRPGFGHALTATIGGAVALAIWLVVVAPANAEFAAWTPHSVPANWTFWRLRWGVGHAVALIPLLTSIIALTHLPPTSRAQNSRTARRIQ